MAATDDGHDDRDDDHDDQGTHETCQQTLAVVHRTISGLHERGLERIEDQPEEDGQDDQPQEERTEPTPSHAVLSAVMHLTVLHVVQRSALGHNITLHRLVTLHDRRSDRTIWLRD